MRTVRQRWFYIEHIALADRPGGGDARIESWEGRELFRPSQPRFIDQHPFMGTGHYTALRPLQGAGEPETLWVTEPDYGAWKVDVGHREYLEILQLTKGAFSWRSLFTRAPLGDEEFERVSDRIGNMLDTLEMGAAGSDLADQRVDLGRRTHSAVSPAIIASNEAVLRQRD